MTTGAIDGKVSIEDLVREHPAAVGFLVREGIPCLVCGEPVWGTLEQVAGEGGRTPADIDRLVAALNMSLGKGTH